MTKPSNCCPKCLPNAKDHLAAPAEYTVGCIDPNCECHKPHNDASICERHGHMPEFYDVALLRCSSYGEDGDFLTDKALQEYGDLRYQQGRKEAYEDAANTVIDLIYTTKFKNEGIQAYVECIKKKADSIVLPELKDKE